MRKYQTSLIIGGLLLVILIPCLLLTLFSINALKSEELLYQRRLELRYQNLFQRWNEQVIFFLKEEEKKLITALLKENPPWNQDWKASFNAFQKVLAKHDLFEYPFLFDFRGVKEFPKRKTLILPSEHRKLQINEILSTPQWYEKQKKYETGFQEYRRLATLYQHEKDVSLRAILGMGRCAFFLGDYSKSLEYYQSILKQYPLVEGDKINPLVFQAFKGEAQVYEKTNNLLKAHKIYTRLYQFLILNKQGFGKFFLEEKKFFTKKLLQTKTPTLADGIGRLKELEKLEQEINRKEQLAMVLDQRFAAFFSDRIKAGRALHGKEEASLFLLPHLNIKAGHLKASTGKRDFALTYFVFAREGRRWIMGVFLRTKKIVRKFLEPKISELQEDKEVRVFINYGKMKDRPDFVARQSLSYPLEDIYLVGVLRDQKLFHHLSNLRVKNYIFAITVAVVLMGLGTLGISYYLFREIQLAQMKSDFVSNVTHELKTPLTSIRMFVETILMGRVKDRQEELECLQIIEKETKRLTQLIEKILEFSSLENKIKQFQFTRCHLDQIIEESIQLFKKQIGNLPCHIEWNTIQKVQAVRGDRESLKEVLLNLFANAFKYCEEVPHIKVNLKESKKYVIVEVIDNGIGIPKKQWKRIFQKFYRVHNLLTSSKEGTGLGLAICKSIIQVHKGKILVQSKLGEGSKFSILLPKQKG